MATGLSINKSKSGFVLIITLWVLGFLTVLALAVGLGARQKIVLLDHLESRSRARLAADAGAKKAIAVLADDLEQNQFVLTAKAKARRHNNPTEFSSIPVGEESFSVSYDSYDQKGGSPVELYGAQDEQAKLNVNTVDRETLARLLGGVLGLATGDARAQAEAIIDWRDFGKHEADGFFSDEYYSSLEFPYDMKERPFERIDELLLVKGIDAEKYARLVPFVTVWGNGTININMVSEQVLEALGIDAALAEKLVKARRGPDGIEATADDHVFNRTFDIASELKALATQMGMAVPEEKELRQIDDLNARNIFTTNSSVYSLRSRQTSSGRASVPAEVACVFNTFTNKIEYWRQK